MRQLKIHQSITTREAPSLDKYLQEVAKEEMINALQEVELAQQIKQGNQQALEKLVKANLRFVISVAKQYQNQGLSLPDLINEGNVGLVKAAHRFDETRGFKFISYAVRRIRQAILQAIAEQAKIVRLPLNQIGNLNKIRKTQGKLEQEFEREPTVEELGIALKMDEKKITTLLQHQPHPTSLDFHPSEDGTGDTIGDIMPSTVPATDHELSMRESMHIDIERFLSTFGLKEQQVVHMFFGFPPYPESGMALEEISGRLGLTKERVRQIKEKVIKKLRKTSRFKHMKEYL